MKESKEREKTPLLSVPFLPWVEQQQRTADPVVLIAPHSHVVRLALTLMHLRLCQQQALSSPSERNVSHTFITGVSM